MVQRALLRAGDGRVGFAELFFDLVFVFAITQVSHHLLDHFTARGAVETGLMFLAVWWVWIYTTWVLNVLDPENGRVRMLLFAMMLGGLFLSMAIPKAFDDRGWVFGLAYGAMQVGRTLFMWRAARGDPVRRATYDRILIWLSAAAVLWVLGGLLPPGLRLTVWVLALGIDYGGPVASYWLPGRGRDASTNWKVNGGHIAERCGLFVIICLGETLLVSGATFARMDWYGTGVAAFLAGVGLAVAMWWVYFHIGHHRGTLHIEQAEDPGKVARLSFTYAHIPIVAGIVLSAVGAERAIAHPADPGGWGDMLALGVGNALFLGGNGWFKRLSARWFPLSHYVGLATTGVAFVAGLWLPLWAGSALMAAVLVLVAVWEDRSLNAPAKA
jgi:low temperature requirement protein LtrA